MAINKDGNGYTFMFSIVMVAVVGVALAFTSQTLKPLQQENEKQEKMQNILAAINVAVEREKAPDEFGKYVKQRIIIDYEGNQISATDGDIDPKNLEDAFNIDVKKEYKSIDKEERNYPLFVCEKEGKQYYVAPMVGTGLWGPIWGFVSLQDDYNTVFGATFDHKTETPGLGAEIKEPMFEDQFPGKMILDEGGNYVSIGVVKGGAGPDNKHGVDAITGGTITSDGVGEMLNRSLETYYKYFNKQ